MSKPSKGGRTTDDYVEYIHSNLDLDYDTINHAINVDNQWDYNYFEAIAGPPFTADEIPILIEDPATTRRILGDGGLDKGQSIKEYDGLLYYVPTEGSCFFKCLAYVTKGDVSEMRSKLKGLSRDTGCVSNYTASTILKKLKLEHQFSIVAWKANARCWQLRHTAKSDSLYRLALVPFNVKGKTVNATTAHWVLFKQGILSHKHPKDIPICIYEQPLTQAHMEKQLTRFRYRPKVSGDKIIVYDIETYKGKDNYQIPYALGAVVLSLKTNERGDYQVFKGERCILDFLDYVITLPSEICQMFAHCGGTFDDYFFRLNKEIEVVNTIKTNTRILSLKIKYQNRKFTLKDSYAFVQTKLSKACETFNTKHVKSEMEHETITPDNWSTREPEWAPYLKLDVLSLADVIFAFDATMKKCGINETVYSHLTISSIAKTFLQKQIPTDKIYIPQHPSACKFIRKAVYGGRIFHNVKLKKPGSENIVCMDVNSLYPAAMESGAYPIGHGYVIENIHQLVEFRKSIQEGTFTGRAIMEVSMYSPKSNYQPILPVRDPELGNIYPTGIIKGVYSDIDVRQALKAGYTLIDVSKVLCWKRTSMYFKKVVNKLYQMRLATTDSSLNFMFKQLLNSSYGVLLKRNQFEEYRYKPTKGVDYKRVNILKNGQREYIYDGPFNPTSPAHIGVFVLAYSRVIVDNYLDLTNTRKNPGVLSGDTDSLYMTRTLASVIKESDVLGGMKNDYGEGKYIEDYVFLGYKRYALKFSDGTYKFKWAGVNFYKQGCITNALNCSTKVFDLYKRLARNDVKEDDIIKQMRWERSVEGIMIIERKIALKPSNVRRKFLDPYTSKPLHYKGKNIPPLDYVFRDYNETALVESCLAQYPKYAVDSRYLFVKPLTAHSRYVVEAKAKALSRIIPRTIHHKYKVSKKHYILSQLCYFGPDSTTSTKLENEVVSDNFSEVVISNKETLYGEVPEALRKKFKAAF